MPCALQLLATRQTPVQHSFTFWPIWCHRNGTRTSAKTILPVGRRSTSFGVLLRQTNTVSGVLCRGFRCWKFCTKRFGSPTHTKRNVTRRNGWQKNRIKIGNAFRHFPLNYPTMSPAINMRWMGACIAPKRQYLFVSERNVFVGVLYMFLDEWPEGKIRHLNAPHTRKARPHSFSPSFTRSSVRTFSLVGLLGCVYLSLGVESVRWVECVAEYTRWIV